MNRTKGKGPPRAVRVMGGLLAVGLAAGAIACGGVDRAAGPGEVLADGPAGSARIVTTVRGIRSGAVVATLQYADTTTAPIVATDGSLAIDLNVVLGKSQPPRNPGDQRLPGVGASASSLGALEIARDERQPLRQGRWTRAVRLRDGRSASVEFVAEGGGPVSMMTVRVDGVVVSSDERRWTRDRGVWRLSGRTLTAYRDGRAVGWAETRVSAPALRMASAAERVRAAAAGGLRAGVEAAADVLAPRSAYAQAMTGPCATQANAEVDAINDYLNADYLFGAALLSGNPFAAAGAFGNLLRAARKVDDMDARLDACVAAA